MSFPKDFVWGASAASYQIEGSLGADGAGESVWDMVCRRPGFVKNGDRATVGCDHVNRYREDVGLMKDIGLQAYRLSIMWPRILPQGVGAVNQAGLDFYDRLVDELLAADITPWVTLFHWDFPLALFYRGGWLSADAPDWFEEYARVVVDALSDRVQHWMTLNEPACFIHLGHQAGTHAPGLQLADAEVLRVWHHALLAHGRAVRVIRESSSLPSPLVGAAPCMETCQPASDRPEDIEAAREHMMRAGEKNLFLARWNIDPWFHGAYPPATLDAWGDAAPVVGEGDMASISRDLDFLGLNLYCSSIIRAGEDGRPDVVEPESNHPRTAFGWPVTPEALRWATRFLYDEYGKPIVITENGVSLHDWVSADGKVHDPNRIDFLAGYLNGLGESIDEGVDVRAYFHWSILDNFEWAEGFKQRFGFIHVDYETGQRTLKDSAYWYRDVIAGNGAPLRPGAGVAHA